MWEIDFALQIKTLIYSVVYGVFASFFWDILRGMRAFFLRRKLFTFIADLFFFIINAIVLFCFFLTFTNGEIRGYVFFGIIIGFIVFRITLSKFILRFCKKFFIKLKKIILKIIKIKNSFLDKILTFLSGIFAKTVIFFKKTLKKTKKALKKQ